MLVNKVRDSIFENYYKRIGFSNKSSYYSMKRLEKHDFLFLTTKSIEKIPDPCNAKIHYQSFVRKKNTKSVKQSKIVTYQPKTCESSNIVDVKSVITAHQRTEKEGKSRF